MQGAAMLLFITMYSSQSKAAKGATYYVPQGYTTTSTTSNYYAASSTTAASSTRASRGYGRSPRSKDPGTVIHQGGSTYDTTTRDNSGYNN
ncbi:hypothetical protein K490DRAFT_64385 [Saccharata proteae CBS 121410]|uniref:Uncharacterized protein n=1 Tax=Saccharata proteae CBS 121410 TaxID=1314787 RepID=A0A6A5YBT7_9PEZI|nr:hypothetical protein K490DRAFT_64385 [Saccharata proteae CBS 121410]